MKLTYEQWIKEVDSIISARADGLTSEDIDACYHDMWQDGDSPERAAKRAIKRGREACGW